MMKRVFFGLVILAFVLVVNVHTHAAIIAEYDFEAGGSGNTFGTQAGLYSVDTQADSIATILTTGGPEGLDGGGANNIFNGSQTGSASGPPLTNWGNGNNTEATANYAQFTTSPTAGNQIAYESLSLYHAAFNTTPDFKITYAIGAGADVVALGQTDQTTTLTLKTEDFADFTTSETVTWKIHVFNANDTQSGSRFDDIIINGTVSLIPEPSTFALSALGLLGLLGWRRGRRR